eukprot:11224433-Ditylum_brightwellii.AAC.1
MDGDGGNTLSQNTAKCTSSTTILPGILSNGTVTYAARTLSCTVRFKRSMSPMCSSSEHTIRSIPLP